VSKETRLKILSDAMERDEITPEDLRRALRVISHGRGLTEGATRESVQRYQKAYHGFLDRQAQKTGVGR